MRDFEHIPVVIIGAGPAGLTAALFLARQGINVRVIERHPGTSIHPRARGLNVRTMEIYRSADLEATIEQAGKALAKSKYMLFVETLAGQEIRRVPDDDLLMTGEALAAYTPCTWVQCAQDNLEPLVLETARQAGAEIRFGLEATGLSQEQDRVLVDVHDVETGAIHTLQAQYVIVADGAGGNIHTSLRIPTAELAVQGHYVNMYFQADLSHLVQGREFALCFVETSAAPGIILAVNNTDRWLFNAEYDPETTSPQAYTHERCLEVIREAVGIPDLAVEILSVLPWDATARYAQQMHVGRVFLMGDAAHTMPPAGGFGLNTGVADAHNLAWKLGLVLQGKAAPTLLTTYEEERFPIARELVEQAARELTAERPDAPPDTGPEGFLVPVLGFSYASTAVLTEPGSTEHGLDLSGRPGTRLPHVWLERDNKRISALDLVDDHFVLLVGSEGDGWKAAVQACTEQLHIPLTLYRIGGETVHDPSGTWCEQNGVGKTGAVLVRPDGIVAWRTKQLAPNPATVLINVLTHVLGTANGR